MVEATGYLHTLLTQLFLVPCQVTLVISATRLYRALANFSSPVSSYDISSIQSFFRAHNGVCVIVAHNPKNRPATATYERIARCQILANIRPSYTYLPADWRLPCTKPMRSTQCHIRTTLVPRILAQMDRYTTSRTRLASMTIRMTTQKNKYHTTMYQWNVTLPYFSMKTCCKERDCGLSSYHVFHLDTITNKSHRRPNLHGSIR
jgi:hypothetical protein